jgi:hypothetical protein
VKKVGFREDSLGQVFKRFPNLTKPDRQRK